MATRKSGGPPAKAAPVKRVPAKKLAAAAPPPAAAAPAAAAAPPADTSADFGEFFSEIGKGLVDAQTQMDAKSREYLAGVKGKDFLLPSVFRIPRVKAEMKFAMTKGTEKKFNLLFFGSNSSAQTQHQQSVEFEVVSAPPPTLGSLPPVSYEPVFNAARRAAIFKTIEAIPGSAAAFAQLLQAPKDQILILVNESAFQFLLMRTGAAPGQLGLWFLIAKPETPPVLATLRSFSASDAGGIGDVRSAISAEGVAQEKFLSELG